MCSNISSCPFPHISSLLPKTTSLPPPKKLAGYVPDIHIGGAGTKNLTHLNILYTIPLPSILLFFFTLSHQNVLRLYNINLQNLDMATYDWLPKFGCLCPKSLIVAACARVASLAYHGCHHYIWHQFFYTQACWCRVKFVTVSELPLLLKSLKQTCLIFFVTEI